MFFYLSRPMLLQQGNSLYSGINDKQSPPEPKIAGIRAFSATGGTNFEIIPLYLCNKKAALHPMCKAASSFYKILFASDMQSIYHL